MLEDVAAVVVTVLIEVIVDRGVDGGKLLGVFMSPNFAIAPSNHQNHLQSGGRP